jgi:tRNA uridine 5-carboxymethylaminomethyl modification enzyme
MFTSRAEYRLLLREDNADLRLTEVGYRIGLASEKAYRRTEEKRKRVAELVEILENTRVSPTPDINASLESVGSARLRSQCSLAQLLRRPEISFADLPLLLSDLADVPSPMGLQAEVEIKYSGYVERQMEGVKRFRKMEALRLPEDLDYSAMHGLSREVREKLTSVRPRTLGQASRISGITPAAISLLSVYLKKRRSA